MTRDEMVTELAYELGVSVTAADQGYGTTRLQRAIQTAYTELVKRAKLNGNKRYFAQVKETVWPLGQLRLDLPAEVKNARWLDFVDYTAGEPGAKLREGNDYGWYDNDTIQWLRSIVGPSQDRSIRWIYETVAETLTASSVPQLVPPDHHRVIVLKARNQLRMSSDDYLPQGWIDELSESELDYYKYVATARPLSNPTALASVTEDEDIL